METLNIKNELGNYEDRAVVYAPMWYHTRGLSQTATGYGSKLNTGYKILYLGKLRRVYAVCVSNCSSSYVIVKKSKIFLGV